MAEKLAGIKTVLDIIIVVLCAFATVLFLTLYIENTDGYFYAHAEIFAYMTILLVGSIMLLTIIFTLYNKDFAFKLGFMTLTMLASVSVGLYIIKVTGLWDRIDSVEDLRDFIASTGALSVVIFLTMQILQVVVLPIPGFIAVGAGVALFGAFKGAILSFIGIYAGSLIGFFVGRIFGYRAAAWLVGKDNLEKALQMVKGKDKIVITFMFLFPFFPDDILCFVAGISTMSFTFFSIMCAITRLISIFVTAYSLSGSIIPYNTWWGILIYIVFAAITVALSIFVYKKGESIENFFKRKNHRRKQT